MLAPQPVRSCGQPSAKASNRDRSAAIAHGLAVPWGLCRLSWLTKWTSSTPQVLPGASLVGSSTLGVPPGTDMRNVYVDDRYESKPWFDLGALKRETKVAVKTLREALESTKR